MHGTGDENVLVKLMIYCYKKAKKMRRMDDHGRGHFGLYEIYC